MRDGASLRTDLYLPKEQKRCPVVLVRTPYGSLKPLHAALGQRLVSRGYGLVVQNVRGRYGSEGRFQPFLHERADALQTVDWLTQQGWWSGQLGMLGISYGAYASLAPAYGPPSGVRMASVWLGGFADPYRLIRHQGVLHLHWALPASLLWSGTRAELPGGVNWLDAWRTQQLPAGADATLWQEWLDHPDPDEYWQARHAPPATERAAPALHLVGWQDFLVDSAMALYRSGTPRDQLIVGPWDHASLVDQFVAHLRGRPESPGELDLAERVIRWFDRWLLQQAGDPERPVLIHTEGAGWSDLPAWPPPAERQRLCLHNQGLSERPPRSAGQRQLAHDPDAPVPTVGGAVWTFHPWLRSGFATTTWPTDQAEQPALCGVTGPPLSEARVVQGAAQMDLFVTAVHQADCHAALADIAPDGSVRLVTDGVARHPGGGKRRLQFPLLPTAYRFGRGHRPGLLLSLSSFPRYPSAGAPLEVTLHWGPDCPSALELPWSTSR